MPFCDGRGSRLPHWLAHTEGCRDRGKLFLWSTFFCAQDTEKYSYELPKTCSKQYTKGEIEDRQCGGGGGEEQGDAGYGGAEQAHRPEELSQSCQKNSQSRPKVILKLSQSFKGGP